MPLVLAAMPSFQRTWEQEVREAWADEDPPTGRLDYLDASAATRHAVARLARGKRAEVQAFLAVVERLHVEGDQYVQELATIGYLEDFQAAVQRRPGLSYNDVLPLLGAESRKWWEAVERFWTGEASVVQLEENRD